ncbi:hypothetical protein FSP39_015824 [Pinctada imbricata]|uniref:Uncharacterized protein n=1 Tax=Pinctada imbricata TaxID=66713 RepID=A0AA89BYS8_PINIB|nr:hypothetical protein FSP39_015824 [Pinctada imbricata]
MPGSECDAIVPGVTEPGNKRPKRPPKTKGSGRKLQEVKAKIPAKSPVLVENLSPETTDTLHDISTSLEEISQKHYARSRGHPASLKDLCADDKRRVANLIKELAKMGDEKEKVMGQMKEEREVFEKQIITLVQQQEQILKEREEIQAQYFQCQDLLARYKDHILDSEDSESNPSPQPRIEHRKERQRKTRSPEAVNRDERHAKQVMECDKERQRKTRSPEAVNRDERHAKEVMECDKENIHKRGSRNDGNIKDLESAKTSVRRPYTSLIDREIAKKKHYDTDIPSTIMVESACSTPRGQVGYHEKVPTLKVFREPVMSSTQKSADIGRELDLEEFMPVEQDSSPRSTIPDPSPRGKSGSRVGFKEKLEFNDDDLQKHSPSLNSGSVVGDRQYMEKYKKLNSAERKKELLRQRELLLKEQDKLKKILVEQEKALRSKQDLLKKKQELQRDRIQYFEENGNFPKRMENVSPQIDVDDGSVFSGKVEKLNLDRHLSDDDIKPYSDDEIPREIGRKRQTEKEDIKNYTTKATSPLPHHYHSMGTSPIRLESQNGLPAPVFPSHVDACTSISRILDKDEGRRTPTHLEDVSKSAVYKNPRSPKSPRLADFSDESRQNNLPIQSNRQRSNDSAPRTPGDKTLSVVEIVNSLEESASWRGSVHKSRGSPVQSEASTGREFITPRVAGTAKIYSTSPDRRPVTYSGEVVRDQFDETEAEETAEESEILDDIFFLK